jgi:hypothetical protein
MAMAGGGQGGGMPSYHDGGAGAGGGGVSEPVNVPDSARQAKVAGMLERARHQAAGRGHAMSFDRVAGADAYQGRCMGCQASMGVTAEGITEGSTAHRVGCNNRSHGALGAGGSVAINHHYNLDEYIAAQAASEAGGAAPFVREAAASVEEAGGKYYVVVNGKRTGKGYESRSEANEAKERHSKEGASGLDQIQQVVNPHEDPAPTPLPGDVMFPITEPWSETSTGGSNTGTPSRAGTTGSVKTADMFGASDAPHAAPGTETPVANSPATTPPMSNSGDYSRGHGEGQADRAAGEAPSFADRSAGTSPYVQGYVEGFTSGSDPQGAQDVPVSMGGDNNQAANFARIEQAQEKPLTVARLTVSASLLAEGATDNEEFRRGYRYARSWREGDQVVALGSPAEEAGIYAGITDNPGYQRAFTAAHRDGAQEFPELGKRLREHRTVTSALMRKHEDLAIQGLYVQAATSLDLDTMAPTTRPDPQGSTPSEGPGSIPLLRDAPGTPAAPGGASPYNGAEPFGQPVVPDPMIQDLNATPPPVTSPDAVHMQGDSSLLTRSPQSMAFRKTVQANKLALRQQQKEN